MDSLSEEEDKLRVEIRIISGQYLPKPGTAKDDDVIDPYVTMQVFGVPCDSVKHKTSVIHNNGSLLSSRMCCPAVLIRDSVLQASIPNGMRHSG